MLLSAADLQCPTVSTLAVTVCSTTGVNFNSARRKQREGDHGPVDRHDDDLHAATGVLRPGRAGPANIEHSFRTRRLQYVILVGAVHLRRVVAGLLLLLPVRDGVREQLL